MTGWGLSQLGDAPETRCPYRDGLRAPLVPQGPGTPTPTDPRPDVLGPDSQLVYQGLSCPSPRPSPLFVYELLGAGDPSCPLSPRATKGLLAGHVAWVSASPSVSPGDGHGCGQAAPAGSSLEVDQLFPRGLCAWPENTSLGSLSQWEGFRGSGCSAAWPWGRVTAGCAGEGGAGGLGSPQSKGERWGKPKEMRGGWSGQEARAEGSSSLLAPQCQALSLPRAQERRQPLIVGPHLRATTEPRLGHGGVLSVTVGLSLPCWLVLTTTVPPL